MPHVKVKTRPMARDKPMAQEQSRSISGKSSGHHQMSGTVLIKNSHIFRGTEIHVYQDPGGNDSHDFQLSGSACQQDTDLLTNLHFLRYGPGGVFYNLRKLSAFTSGYFQDTDKVVDIFVITAGSELSQSCFHRHIPVQLQNDTFKFRNEDRVSVRCIFHTIQRVPDCFIQCGACCCRRIEQRSYILKFRLQLQTKLFILLLRPVSAPERDKQ